MSELDLDADLFGDVEVTDPPVQGGDDQTGLVPDDLRQRRVRDGFLAHGSATAQLSRWL